MIMERLPFFILGMAALLPIGDCYTSPGKGGYPVGPDGNQYTCRSLTDDIYCRCICDKYSAGIGYCYGLFTPTCYCESLTRYGGYPLDENEEYYPCLSRGKNKWCQTVCIFHRAGYGYCYGVIPYCYCERLTDENQHLTFPH